jgi:signal transduction histidine kinase
MPVDRAVAAPHRWSLRARLTLLLAAVGGLLAATLAAQIALQAHQRDVRNDLLRNIEPARVASADLKSAIVDQETSVRGYALTGDTRFLESYASGVEAADGALDQLDALLRPHQELDDEVATARTLMDGWQTASAQPVIDAATDAERTIVRSEEFQETGLRRMDGLQAAIDDIDDELTTQRADLVDDLDDAARRSTWAMFIQVAGVLLSGVIILGALARLVVGPIGRLGRDARRVANGDLDHPVRGEGSPDLTRLGSDVDAMRTRILAELDRLNAATAHLEQKAGELARSNADLEQFAYVASHDLQEPLRKVSSFCQLLQKRYSGQLDERADEYIHYAVDGAKHMQDLINDLLAFSQVGRTSESFEPVDLAAVVTDVLDALGPAIDAAHARVTVGKLPEVTGDRRLLTTALQNLIANALKFRGPAPPTVDIAASLNNSAAGDEWVIAVTDNGIGIDPGYGEQIFVMFKRLHGKAEYAGTGIGLPLAKKIIEFHGGRIWLEATPPPGSTFKVALPALRTTERTPTDAG